VSGARRDGTSPETGITRSAHFGAARIMTMFREVMLSTCAAMIKR
jgi:hypothetical protein